MILCPTMPITNEGGGVLYNIRLSPLILTWPPQDEPTYSHLVVHSHLFHISPHLLTHKFTRQNVELQATSFCGFLALSAETGGVGSRVPDLIGSRWQCGDGDLND